MSKQCAVAALTLVLTLGFGSPPASAELPVVRIGIVVDGPWSLNPTVKELTVSGVTALTEGDVVESRGGSSWPQARVLARRS